MSAKQSSKLLIDESPLQVLPSLAVAVGLNEAIVLQQVHYWLKNAQEGRRTEVYRDDRWWVYNSYEDWRDKAFPFWSSETIARIFKGLTKRGLLLTGQLAINHYDRRKWYSIDYDVLDALNVQPSILPTKQDASYQVDSMQYSKMTRSNLSKCQDVLTEITTKTTTETTDREIAADAAPPVKPSKSVLSEPKKPVSRQRKEPAEETAYYAECVPVVARVCRIDLAITGEWARCKKPLQALYHATIRPTPELLAVHYEIPTGYWYAHDFRGKQGDPPEPHWIQNTWGKATSGAPRVVNGNGHARAAPPPQTDGIGALRAKLTGQLPPEPDVIEGRYRHG